jgi:hypothetical protein
MVPKSRCAKAGIPGSNNPIALKNHKMRRIDPSFSPVVIDKVHESKVRPGSNIPG